MHSFRRRLSRAGAAVIAISLMAGQSTTAQHGRHLDVGQPLSEAELRSWNIDVGMDGAGLPPGQGSVQAGKALYETKCIACHGVEGQGQPMDQLAGGHGTLKSAKPVKTIGSYWPYATTVFDYVRRAMPMDKPQSLSPDEVYALTAYLLHLNGIVGREAIMNAQTLPMVRMPNRAAFHPDPRPDVSNSACRSGCQ
jgi:S-disulfanyl-L-cysteine oxidoreductase SoxD